MDLKTYFAQGRGRQAALAKALRVHAPDLSRMADGIRPIPFPLGAPIEKETNRQVTRQEMFPNDWQELWPELVNQDRAELPYAIPNRKKRREASGPLTRIKTKPPD